MISPDAQEVHPVDNEYLSYVAFTDCPRCHGMGYHIHYTNYFTSYTSQCGECAWMNEQWKRSHPIIYRVSRKQWYTAEEPVWNKKLGKLEWKKVKHHPETTQVYAYALIDGKQEQVYARWWKDTSMKDLYVEFSNIEQAQQWIAEQEAGNIAEFWTKGA